MTLRPRHYILLAVLIALAAYNALRFYRAHHAAATNNGASTRGTSPAWNAYDKAADQRDADDQSFQAAQRELKQAIEDTGASQQQPPAKSEMSDLEGCRTWLLFYRQSFLHPASAKPEFREQAAKHVLSCRANHQDAVQ